MPRTELEILTEPHSAGVEWAKTKRKAGLYVDRIRLPPYPLMLKIGRLH